MDLKEAREVLAEVDKEPCRQSCDGCWGCTQREEALRAALAEVDRLTAERERLRMALNNLCDQFPRGEGLRHFHAGNEVHKGRSILLELGP
jgi:hypothetical protein